MALPVTEADSVMNGARNYADVARNNVGHTEEVDDRPGNGMLNRNISPHSEFGRRPTTVIVKANQIRAGNKEVLDALLAFDIEPRCVQQNQNRDFVVTLRSVADRDRLFNSGKLNVNGVLLPVADPELHVTFITVMYAPFEMSVDVFRHRLSDYGKVIDIRRNTIFGTEVFNGHITIRIALYKHIPSFIQFGSYSVMIRYPGQPRTCRRCDGLNHEAAGCQKYKCFNCGQPGHSKNMCPEPPLCGLCGSESHSLRQCFDFWEVEDENEDDFVWDDNAEPLEEEMPFPDPPENLQPEEDQTQEIEEGEIVESIWGDVSAPPAPAYSLQPSVSATSVDSQTASASRIDENPNDQCSDSEESCLSVSSKREREESDDTVKTTPNKKKHRKKERRKDKSN